MKVGSAPKRSITNILVKPDAKLAQIVGDKPIARTEIVKRVWQYIKKNCKMNSRNIVVDKLLGELFGVAAGAEVFMMKVASMINNHLVK